MRMLPLEYYYDENWKCRLCESSGSDTSMPRYHLFFTHGLYTKVGHADALVNTILDKRRVLTRE